MIHVLLSQLNNANVLITFSPLNVFGNLVPLNNLRSDRVLWAACLNVSALLDTIPYSHEQLAWTCPLPLKL